MKKIRAIIEKKDGKEALLKSNGFEFFLPKEFVVGNVGDAVNITLTNNEEDQKKSSEVAKELLRQAFIGEK